MASAHTATASASTTNRSKLTNNPRRIPGIDNRTAAGRRRRDLVDAFIAGLGGEVSPVKLAQVRRAAELVALAEETRARAFREGAGAVDMETLIRLEGMASRAQRALGLKPESNDFAEFMADKYPEAEEAEGA